MNKRNKKKIISANATKGLKVKQQIRGNKKMSRTDKKNLKEGIINLNSRKKKHASKKKGSFENTFSEIVPIIKADGCVENDEQSLEVGEIDPNSTFQLVKDICNVNINDVIKEDADSDSDDMILSVAKNKLNFQKKEKFSENFMNTPKTQSISRNNDENTMENENRLSKIEKDYTAKHLLQGNGGKGTFGKSENETLLSFPSDKNNISKRDYSEISPRRSIRQRLLCCRDNYNAEVGKTTEEKQDDSTRSFKNGCNISAISESKKRKRKKSIKARETEQMEANKNCKEIVHDNDMLTESPSELNLSSHKNVSSTDSEHCGYNYVTPGNKKEKEEYLCSSENQDSSTSGSSTKRRQYRKHGKKTKHKKAKLKLNDLNSVTTEVDNDLNQNFKLNEHFDILDIGSVKQKDSMESTQCIDSTPPEDIRYIGVNLHDDFHGILLPFRNQVIGIKGYMQLAVACGQVDVSGYKMVAGGDTLSYVDVFSPTTSSLYYVKDLTVDPCQDDVKEKLKKELETTFHSTKEKIDEIFRDIQEVYACIVVKKLYSVLPALLEKLNSFTGFSGSPKFLPQPFQEPVVQANHWSDMFDGIESEISQRNDAAFNKQAGNSEYDQGGDEPVEGCSCSIMLCGGSNVGKSTLSRFIINRMLARHKAVFFLDCDCGQTEFTPAAVLSLVKVTKPLLGPPFSHQMKAVKSYFFGHISPGQTPCEYIKLIGYLFQTYYMDYISEGPLVVNQQGWMTGLGISLLVDCIRITSPCYIVQIISSIEKVNSPENLSDEFLAGEEGWSIDVSYKCIKKSHGCKYHILHTTDVQKNAEMGRNKSRASRQRNVTSYFSGLYQSSLDNSISSGEKHSDWIPPAMSTLYPYVVRWEDVALHVMHEKTTPDVMLYGFNIALVCLAHVDPELIKAGAEDSKLPNYLLDKPVAELIGFGIVRNIDEEAKVFYILTPEPVESLVNVNALLRGSVQLPTTYFLEDIQANDAESNEVT